MTVVIEERQSRRLDNPGFEPEGYRSSKTRLTLLSRGRYVALVSFFRNSILRSFLAAGVLVAWAVSYHHDTWLALSGVDHHHEDDHHHPAESPEHGKGGEHHPEDSLPLADTHSTVVVFGVKKSPVSAPMLAGDFPVTLAFLPLGPGCLIVGGHEDPPRCTGWPGHVTLRHLILADRVQANAPPILS